MTPGRMAQIRAETLGYLSDAVAAIEEAREFAYSRDAAWQAAFDHLEIADLDELRQVAATLAMVAVFDLQPAGGVGFGMWIESQVAWLSAQDVA